MGMARITHRAVLLRRNRCSVMIAMVRVFDVDRAGVMVVARMRRCFAHAAVRKHKNTGQQQDDHTAHVGRANSHVLSWQRACRQVTVRAFQIVLGHAIIESTFRYLGVDVEDALELAQRTEV